MGTDMRLSMLATVLLISIGAGARAQQVPQAPNTTFFVTSTPIGKGGDLGGLAGADAHCQQLATAVGAGDKKTWHAYLSTNANAPGGAVNARDRIGDGPWQNTKGVVIAQNVDDLHSADNKLARETALTERGTIVSGFGFSPVWHDALTGSDREGRAFPPNINMTCNNWSSSTVGKAMLGHIDRTGLADNEYARSWNSSHQSRGCSEPDLIATGGNGMVYCFATVLPSRTFAGPTQYPPTRFKAYGIVAFNSRPTSGDRSRYDMICDAYVSGLLHYTEVKAPIEQQMVTVWPIDKDGEATQINAIARDKVCARAFPNYGLSIAQEAIETAKRAKALFNGRGPFLLAWAPGTQKGQTDALVLVSDLSNVVNIEDAKSIFAQWSSEIQQNPDIWNNGWDVSKLTLMV